LVGAHENKFQHSLNNLMDLAHKDEYSYLQQFATSTRKRNASNLLLDLSTFAIKCE
jgi:hypothetical protein